MIASSASRSLFDHSEDNSEENSVRSEPQFESTAIVSPVKAPTNAADAFSRELTKLQEEQVVYIKRIDKEKQRKEQLEDGIEEAKLRLRLIQDKTKNGNIVKDHEMTNKKLMGRLEHQLQMSKIKLSTSKNENITLKAKVQDLRREKLLHLQILNDLAKEISNAKRRTKYCQKEIGSINEKKHKVKVGITSIKQKMIRDMEDFSSELSKAKQNINTTQVNIMNTIREKLQQSSLLDSISDDHLSEPNNHHNNKTQLAQSFKKGFTSTSWKAGSNNLQDFNYGLTGPMSKRPATSGAHRPQSSAAPAADSPNAVGHNAYEAEQLLKETEFSSIEELLQALQQSEETVFALYNETQSKHEEVEKMELENKYLETKVQEQMKKLHELEGNQEQVKQELEKNIQYFQSQITKYDSEYSKHMEILKSISENLLNLLKNVAVDEAALDQQLLSTGITDRNVGEYLGLIEQRIDDLIQMSKAANHQILRKEDFLKAAQNDKSGGFQAPAPPAILEAEEDEELEGGDAKLQPLNIPVLKEIMNKKVQKMSLLPVYINTTTMNKNAGNGSKASKVGGQSTTSLKSLESHLSM